MITPKKILNGLKNILDINESLINEVYKDYWTKYIKKAYYILPDESHIYTEKCISPEYYVKDIISNIKYKVFFIFKKEDFESLIKVIQNAIIFTSFPVNYTPGHKDIIIHDFKDIDNLYENDPVENIYKVFEASQSWTYKKIMQVVRSDRVAILLNGKCRWRIPKNKIPLSLKTINNILKETKIIEEDNQYYYLKFDENITAIPSKKDYELCRDENFYFWRIKKSVFSDYNISYNVINLLYNTKKYKNISRYKKYEVYKNKKWEKIPENTDWKLYYKYDNVYPLEIQNYISQNKVLFKNNDKMHYFWGIDDSKGYLKLYGQHMGFNRYSLSPKDSCVYLKINELDYKPVWMDYNQDNKFLYFKYGTEECYKNFYKETIQEYKRFNRITTIKKNPVIHYNQLRELYKKGKAYKIKLEKDGKKKYIIPTYVDYRTLDRTKYTNKIWHEYKIRLDEGIYYIKKYGMAQFQKKKINSRYALLVNLFTGELTTF